MIKAWLGLGRVWVRAERRHRDYVFSCICRNTTGVSWVEPLSGVARVSKLGGVQPSKMHGERTFPAPRTKGTSTCHTRAYF